MVKVKKVAILGGGAFGIALSKLSASRAAEVLIWCRDDLLSQSINKLSHHPTTLSSIILPPHVRASSSLSEALSEADVVILAIPFEALRQILHEAADLLSYKSLLVSTAKGINWEDLSLSKDIINETLNPALAKSACFLSGPAFAIELARDLPTAMIIASKDINAAKKFQSWFSSPTCRLYYSSDVIGVCIAGALKNVIAIASGVAHELALGKNAQASLITIGLAEIARLALKMGAEIETLMGLSGVGDLVLTAGDPQSRNFRLGTMLVQGIKTKDAIKSIGTVVEGANSARAITALMKKYDIELPICHTVYRLLYEGLTPLEGLAILLERRSEH